MEVRTELRKEKEQIASRGLFHLSDFHKVSWQIFSIHHIVLAQRYFRYRGLIESSTVQQDNFPFWQFAAAVLQMLLSTFINVLFIIIIIIIIIIRSSGGSSRNSSSSIGIIKS